MNETYDNKKISFLLTFDRGRSFAVVENGELSEYFSRRKDAEEFSLSGHFDFAL